MVIRTPRRGLVVAQIALAVTVSAYQVLNAISFTYDALGPKPEQRHSVDLGLAVFGVAFAAGALCSAAYCVGVLRHEAF